MSTLKQIRSKIKRLVRDDAPVPVLLDPGDYDIALSRALTVYSVQRPRCLTQDLMVDSNYLILTSAITGFDRAYVEKLTIEYPVLLTYGPPNYLDRDQWFLYQSPSGLAIRFIFTPQLGQSVRVTHNVPHIVPVDANGDPDDGGSLTTLASDDDALAAESAAVCCEMLSTYFTQTADKATGADFVAFTTKAGEYKKRADMLDGVYSSYMEQALGMNRGSFKVVRS